MCDFTLFLIVICARAFLDAQLMFVNNASAMGEMKSYLNKVLHSHVQCHQFHWYNFIQHYILLDIQCNIC